MSAPTLKQRTKTLFANYNNINFDTPDEFIDYVFSLPTGGPFLPIAGGELTGDLIIDTVIKDSTVGHIRSADFNNRFLADASGVARYNWNTGITLDAAAKKSIDSNLHQLFDTAATPKKSIDYNLRRFFFNDGTTISVDAQATQMNDATGALAFDWTNRIIQGVGNTAATYGLQVKNLAGTEIFNARNDGYGSLGGIIDANYNWTISGDGTATNATAVIKDTLATLQILGSTLNSTLWLKSAAANKQSIVRFTTNAGDQMFFGAIDGSYNYLQNATGQKFRFINDANHTYGFFDPATGRWAFQSQRAAVPVPGATVDISGETDDNTTFPFITRNNTGAALFSVRGDGNLLVGAAVSASGSFLSADAKTITVTNGIITAIV